MLAEIQDMADDQYSKNPFLEAWQVVYRIIRRHGDHKDPKRILQSYKPYAPDFEYFDKA